MLWDGLLKREKDQHFYTSCLMDCHFFKLRVTQTASNWIQSYEFSIRTLMWTDNLFNEFLEKLMNENEAIHEEKKNFIDYTVTPF